MSNNKAKVTIHMVSSLDGFVAGKDGDVSWLKSTDHYEKGITLTEEAITEFVQAIDCYVMGSHTYEKALELGWPYGETPVIVLTSRDLFSDRPTVEFHGGELTELVNGRLKGQYQNIWMVGGAAATKAFLQLSLADDIIVSIMPVIVGEGTLFFDFVGREQRLHLKDVTTYKDGMVELWYELKKD